MKFTVKNSELSQAIFTAYITVNGQIESVVTDTLSGGASRIFTGTVTRAKSGSYSVGVDELVESFVVLPPQMEVSELMVSPHNVAVGDIVTISGRVTNSGGSPGEYDISVDIAGYPEKTFAGTLPAGGSDSILLKIDRDTPGTYSVSAGGLNSQFVVLAPVVDIEIPLELTVNKTSTEAVDAQGNTLELTENPVRKKKKK